MLAGLGWLSACSQEPAGHPPGDRLEMAWEVLSGDPAPARTFDSVLILANHSEEILGNDWILYFNYSGRILPDPPPGGVRIEPVNGDFFRLVPGPEFRLERESEVRIRFRSAGRPVNHSGAPSGFYLTYVGQDGQESAPASISSRVLAFPAGVPSGGPTPESRYRAAENLSTLPREGIPPLIPTPVQLRRIPRPVVVNSGFQIRYQKGLEAEAEFLSSELEKRMGVRLHMAVGDRASHNTIILRLDRVRVGRPIRGAGSQAYGLLTSPAIGIDIVGTDRAGVFYAIQSLRAVLPDGPDPGRPGQITIPGIDIADAPRFRYRGLHLDVARNFQKPETVFRLLDLMAFYKLNVLHFHISDDQGWRLEIPGLPELTAVGAHRGHTRDESDRLLPSLGSGPDPDPARSSGSGFYSRDDFVEILRHAALRHIRVIPEIDLPGHARAAIKSMEARYRRLLDRDPEGAEEFLLSDPADQSRYLSVQGWTGNVVNVCRESTYRWIGKIVDEVAGMYEEANLKLETFHLGGDEVPPGAWEESPLCRALLSDGTGGGAPRTIAELPAYFLTRSLDLLQHRSVAAAAWEEATLALIARSAGQPEPAEVSEQAPRLIAHLWREAEGPDTVIELTRKGFPVVLSNSSHLYFDQAYENDPVEPGLSWAGFVDTRRIWSFEPSSRFRNRRRELEETGEPGSVRAQIQELNRAESIILGVQGQLWGELLASPERLEYMAFPKLLGLAERAWSAQPEWAVTGDSEKRDRLIREDWELFANTLGQVELPRLDRWEEGVEYRLPPPGAIVEGGLLKANSIFPGLTIRYALNGAPVTSDSPVYGQPLPVSGRATLATFDTRGRSSRTVSIP